MTTLRASEITPGSYFIYAWPDLDNDSVLDISTAEETLLFIFDPFMEYGQTLLEGKISANEYEGPIPNYTFWSDLAPNIEIAIGNQMKFPPVGY